MKKTLYIKGMHCASCEMIIKNWLKNINGVKLTHISAKKWTMDIEIESEKSIKEIEKTINTLWYIVSEKEKKETQRKQIGLSIIIVSLLVVIFNKFNIGQHIPSTGNKISFGIAVITGIIASVSTCLAIVGSIVLGFSEYIDTSKWKTNLIKTHLSFHLGRIIGFFVLGGILWLLWKTFSISLTMTSILTILVWIIVLRMGLHILHIVPSISSLGFHLPKKWSEKTLTTKNPAFAPFIGALTFFLPCGFTLSMQLVAVSSGNIWQWWLIMALFALGTTPILFALGLGSSYIKEKKFVLLHTIIGTLIVFFGIFMLSNGRRLLWWGEKIEATQITNFTGTFETINIWHNWYQTIPTTISLDAGKNYELIITPNSNGKGCMVNMLIPGLDRTVKPIIKNQPIIYKFINIKKWTYTIVCGTMGMQQGEIIVQ